MDTAADGDGDGDDDDDDTMADQCSMVDVLFYVARDGGASRSRQKNIVLPTCLKEKNRVRGRSGVDSQSFEFRQIIDFGRVLAACLSQLIAAAAGGER